VAGHVDLQVRTGLKLRPQRHLWRKHELPEKRRHRRHADDGCDTFRPQCSTSGHLDLPIRRYGPAARQAIARSEPAGIDIHPIRTGRWWRMAAHTHDAEPAALAAPAVG